MSPRIIQVIKQNYICFVEYYLQATVPVQQPAIFSRLEFQEIFSCSCSSVCWPPRILSLSLLILNINFFTLLSYWDSVWQYLIVFNENKCEICSRHQLQGGQCQTDRHLIETCSINITLYLYLVTFERHT